MLYAHKVHYWVKGGHSLFPSTAVSDVGVVVGVYTYIQEVGWKNCIAMDMCSLPTYAGGIIKQYPTV